MTTRMRLRSTLALSVGLLAAGCGGEPAGQSQLAIAIAGNETQPIYSYADAIKEVVYVEADIDSDRDGKLDRIALDVMRPKETNDTLKVATVMEASPYYSDAPQADLSPDRPIPGGFIPRGFRGWYDEFFVPRGYAVVEVEMQGTGRSKGCPTTGAKEDTLSIKAAIDWLNGRAKGYRKDGTEVVASWSTGAVGMLGVSYNGTLPTAVAAAGVEGLKTIVPIAGISSWYDYARDQGIGYAEWDVRYPEWLAEFVVSSSQASSCAASIRKLGDDAGDDSFDYTPFWEERDYRKDVGKMRASVFLVHGQADLNVKTSHFSRLWYALQARDLPRKLWLHKEGHSDPARLRADEWKRVMHHWMDHWLYDVNNGIMDEPMATIQRPDGAWETYASWPEAGTTTIPLYFGPAGDGVSGTLLRSPVSKATTQSFVDDPMRPEKELYSDAEGSKSFRLLYASPILESAVRISGTPRVHVVAASDTTSTPLTAFLVDYGDSTAALPENLSFQELMATACSLTDLENGTGCAAPKRAQIFATKALLVTQGSIDVKNRTSIRMASPLTPGEAYDVEWELLPTDYVFPKGHRIGVVVTANDSTFINVDSRAHKVDISLAQSRVLLPVASGL